MVSDSLYIALIKKVDEINTPFYLHWDFRIATFLGILGVVFSYIAFDEAKKAKIAATEAGKNVKLQTITIELTELIQRLDKLDNEIQYTDARDLYNEVNRRIRRIVSAYQNISSYKILTDKVYNTLNNIKEDLSKIRNNNSDEIGINVYLTIESHFSDLSGLLAELTGVFESNTIK